MNNKSAPKYYVPVNSQDNSNQKPREVEIRVIFLRIGDIDTLNEKFFAEILIESKWEEPKLVEEFTHIHNNLLAAPLGSLAFKKSSLFLFLYLCRLKDFLPTKIT